MSENPESQGSSSAPSSDPSEDRFRGPGESGGAGGGEREAFDLRPGAPDAKGSGCSRNLLIGCGVLLVLLGIVTVLFVLNASKVASWLYTRLEEQVVAELPKDLPEADRQRLAEAFDKVRGAIQDGTVDVGKIQQAQGKMTEMVRHPDAVTAADVRELTALLEAAAGERPAAEEAPTGTPGSGGADSGGGGPPD
jgi:hypothetical protein